jgi:diguanylate cyclase (GGDEF)-like protein
MIDPKRISVTDWLTRIQQRHREFAPELVAISLHRLRYLSWVAIPVSALHLLFFAGFEPSVEFERQWHRAIMMAHTLILVFFLLTSSLATILKTNPNSAAARILCAAGLTAVLAAGISIATIDQWVTYAVTPYLLACTVAGVLFLISPMLTMVIYPAALLVFWHALALTQTDPSVLLSNRVNGLTATGLAMGLSWMLWRQVIVSKMQEQQIKAQQEALESSNQKLHELATRDELTGLANRRLFDMMLTQEISALVRSGQHATLLMLDLDHFKRINDEYGHLNGDLLLQELANVLTSGVRAADLCGRWGGEEFVVLLRDTPLRSAADVAENLRKRIADHLFTIAGQHISMTISIGVAELNATADDALQLAYHYADKALYQAKAEGRNRVVSHQSL